jgi:hypothetical protein
MYLSDGRTETKPERGLTMTTETTSPKTTETFLGLVTCGKDFKTLHIGTVTVEIKNPGKPWASTTTLSATANCAGSRHVSNKHMKNLQNATCPRCRAAYLNEQPAPQAQVETAPAHQAQVQADDVQAGDYLTLAYGAGTQTAYVASTTPARLMVYRFSASAGRWNGPVPIGRKDGRILARTKAPEGAAAPATGFLPAR